MTVFEVSSILLPLNLWFSHFRELWAEAESQLAVTKLKAKELPSIQVASSSQWSGLVLLQIAGVWSQLC